MHVDIAKSKVQNLVTSKKTRRLLKVKLKMASLEQSTLEFKTLL